MHAKSHALAFALPVSLLLLAPPAALAAWPNQPGLNLPVCTAGQGQNASSIVADGAGGAIIAWHDARSGVSNDIYAQHVLPSGAVDPAWPINGRGVCLAPSDQSNPTIASDGAGGAIITWYDYRSGTNRDIYAQHVLASGAVDPAWPVNGRVLCAAANDQYGAKIVSDGAGGAIVTWYDYRSGSSYDIYAQRVLASGVVDPAWPVDGIAVSVAASSQLVPTIVTDGAGGAVITWYDFRNLASYDIYAQHVLASGAVDPAWIANGQVLCAAAGDQSYPVIVSDGVGGAIVSWDDLRGGTYDVYAQHVFATGSVDGSWPNNGRALSVAASDQYGPTIATDGGGGAIVTWTDYRGGPSDIYAQHVLVTGAVDALWPVDGRALCTATGGQDGAVIVADGVGGAIVAWNDTRAASYDIYAQHVLPSGVVDPVWPANGRAMCTAANSQFNASIVADGTGGAIVAWDDYRTGTPDIYAQRVARFGYLGTPEPVIASVKDVANDQGGKVKLSWDASWLDTDPSQVVDHYWIFRSVPTAAAQAALRAGVRVSAVPTASWPGDRELFATTYGASTIYWEFVATQSAYHIVSGYSYLAPTTSDSTGAYNPPTLFMVTAWNAAATQYWSSTPVGGYSVDNLPPATPAPFTGNYAAGAAHLHWNPNSEFDLANYRLYRGASAGFVPGPGNQIASPPDTGYADVGGAGFYYKLSAIDTHGNESGFALLTPGGTTDVTRGAGALALGSPWPNPSVGDVAIALTLPAEARASLAIYDPAGRRVRQVLAGVQPAGEHSLTWDGRDDAGHALAGGLYFLRLETGGRAIVRRLARLD